MNAVKEGFFGRAATEPGRVKPRRLPLPPGSAIRTSEASRFGLTRARLRAASVDHPFTGVSSVGLDQGSIIDTARAFVPLLRPGEAFSHVTAAHLLGAPLPARMESPLPLHVTSPPGTSRSRTRSVIGHESKAQLPPVTAHGLPVVSAALVWCQLAPLLSGADLVAVGDFLVTKRRAIGAYHPPLTSIADLDCCVRRFRGRRGSKRMAWAIRHVRIGAESRPETHLRLLLLAAGLPEPLIGHPTPVEDGLLILHPDLKFPEWRVVLEYEGDRHRTDAKRWRRDITRREQFEDAGWRVIRVTSDDLYLHPERLIARISHIIATRARA
jgi:hypothetical protein